MFTGFSLLGNDNIVQEWYLKDLFFKTKHLSNQWMSMMKGSAGCRMTIYQNYLFYITG